MEKNATDRKESPNVKSLVVVFSYHHGNTEKIATCLCKRAGCQGKNTAAGET